MEKPPSEKAETLRSMDVSSAIFKINILKGQVGKKIVAKLRSNMSHEGVIHSVIGNVLVLHSASGVTVHIDINVLEVWTL